MAKPRSTRLIPAAAIAAHGACGLTLLACVAAGPAWSEYAGNAQHTALAPAASDNLSQIKWQTPVDLDQQISSDGDLYIHYGSPVITQSNTVIVPVKTGAYGGFEMEAINGATGAVNWTQNTNYILPAHNWVPEVGPALSPNNTLYYPGAGGTVFSISAPDTSNPGHTPPAAQQLAFYGLGSYTSNQSTYNSNVFIDTPITTDAAGDIYFGFRVTGSNPANLQSGIARIASNGAATWISANAASGNTPGIDEVLQNSAPALSNDGKTLYVAVSTGNGTSDFGPTGDLVALNASTLAPISHVALNNVSPSGAAYLPDDGSASPMVGPDGHVYMGVLDSPAFSNNDRGWMLQFSADLKTEGTPGAFGWDDTASVVPASMVPSYKGTSTYLLMTKYNNYADPGLSGNGVNKIAILDPNATESYTPFGGSPTLVMNEVLSIAGPTPDPNLRNPAHPDAVTEWCINSAVVDPATDSILVNNEDGNLYRWDLATNTFTQEINLTAGIGEAYTPTLVGPDGTVYAINDSRLFAVVPEPAAASLALGGALMLIALRPHRRLRLNHS